MKKLRIKMKEDFWKNDVSNMAELKSLECPSHHKDTNSTTIHETTPFVRNAEIS